MKITNDGIVAAQEAKINRGREKTSGAFQEILKNITNSETASPEKASASQSVFQPFPVLLDTVGSEALLQKLDDSLALLESYQSRLENKAIPIHELRPDVDRLEDQQNQLESELLALPDDHPMKDLLNRSVVTMAVEIEKYRRGDFH